MLKGLDLSSVQGRVDWPSIKAAGYSFALLKCSTGNDTGVDSQFAANVAGARAVGIPVGPYHFAYPLQQDALHPGRDPVTQARLAFTKCGGLGSNDGEINPVVDAEWPAPQDWVQWGCTDAQIRAWLIAYLEEASQLWGCAPIVYTYPYWWSKVSGSLESKFAAYSLWMADYAKFQTSVPPDGSSPIVPSPWNDWTIWQHSGGQMHLPNGTPCDMDVIRDQATLDKLLYGTS
jgi:GH25 family lysozyme M1 (1,4-beta-N-acetylmuramidase)